MSHIYYSAHPHIHTHTHAHNVKFISTYDVKCQMHFFYQERGKILRINIRVFFFFYYISSRVCIVENALLVLYNTYYLRECMLYEYKYSWIIVNERSVYHLVDRERRNWPDEFRLLYLESPRKRIKCVSISRRPYVRHKLEEIHKRYSYFLSQLQSCHVAIIFLNWKLMYMRCFIRMCDVFKKLVLIFI